MMRASSTGVMLEMARLVCAQNAGKVRGVDCVFRWGRGGQPEWKDPDNRYGSRQMAAKLAQSGDLPKIKAFILVDLVGGKNPHFLRDGESTPWLKDFVWSVAAKLGYEKIFGSAPTNFGGDDHYSFTARHVPSVDIMDLDPPNDVPYWHTPQDTLDKISPKTLAIVGHVVLESVKGLQKNNPETQHVKWGRLGSTKFLGRKQAQSDVSILFVQRIMRILPKGARASTASS